MKKIKKLGFLLSFILVFETVGVHSNVKVVKASGREEYTSYLLQGFDAIQNPVPNASEIKGATILDRSKLQDMKGSYWNVSLPGRNSFKFISELEDNSFTLEKSVAIATGAKGSVGAVGLSGNVSREYSERNFQKELYGRMMASWVIDQYALALNATELGKCLTSGFQSAVNSGDYKTVFKRYGTHIVSKVSVGGRLIVNYQSKDASFSSKETIKAGAEASYGTLSGSASADYSKSVENFKKYCKYSFEGIGGNVAKVPQTFDQTGSYADWYESIKEDPAMYQIEESIPIWELFRAQPNVYKAMQRAYYEYYNEHLIQLKNSIPFVTDIRVCSRNNSNVDSELQWNEKVTKTDARLGCINSDLNRGSHGKWIYLVYKTGTDHTRKIIDVREDARGKSTNQAATPGYTFVPGDLNEKVGGDWIYINYKRVNDVNKSYTGYQAFCTRNTTTPLSEDWVPIRNAQGQQIDLNKGAGGDYIYLFGYKDPLFKNIQNQMNLNNQKIASLR